ncbi:MAG: SUMF1/EgtB/PvdO family nonheme iron enzyme [Nitrospirota bacterium]|nr:SUMF1/EgtB/PvdO family nonheme iron enzyme [Nitrospirota bacterium]
MSRIAVLMAALLWAAPAAALPPGTPFTEVSTEACGACHGPDGAATPVRPAQGECAECHGGSHEAPLSRAADAGPARPGPVHGPDLSNMARIPAGPAIIGNDGREITEGEGNLDETPEHVVELPAYYIDLYEVTNRRYSRYVTASGGTVNPPRHWKNGMIPEGREEHPVVFVSWFDADDFCRWEGKRLPNELEWEKAARGPDGNVFPWGNHFELERANTPQRWASMNDPGHTMPVGSFPSGKSPYGLFDMSGNVWEWTDSWYQPYPGNEFPNNFYGEKNRVLRGGSWYDCLSYGCGLSAPSFNRSRFTPKIKNSSFGFRCAADAPAASNPETPEARP